jgi:hypothetical protein
MGGCFSTPADAPLARLQSDAAGPVRLASGGSLVPPARASDSLSGKLPRADSLRSAPVMRMDVIAKVRPRLEGAGRAAAARARVMRATRADRAAPIGPAPTRPAPRPRDQTPQVQGLQQALTLLSGEPLLALPDAAEVLAEHLGVDLVG